MLSVILPVYNCEKYVERAIQSVLDQSFRDFELIISDDGSVDSSAQIIARYQSLDHRIIVSNNLENQGKVKTVNRLFDLCRGEYLTIHDADDFSIAHRFEKQMDLLQHSEYVLCGTAFYTFDQQGNYINTVTQPQKYEEIKLRAQTQSCFHGPTMIFRKNVVQQVGGLYRMMKMGEDVDFSMRVTERYPTTNLSEPLYAYMLNAEAITKSLKYDLLGRQIDHEIKYYMVEQRKKHPKGLDSMMEKDFEAIDAKIADITERFYQQEDAHIRFRLGYLLSVHLYKNAFVSSLNYLLKKRSFSQLREFVYVCRHAFIGALKYSFKKKISIDQRIMLDQQK